MREQTDYVGNMIYENNALKCILVDGGYVEDGNYYFYETDHLGNNRVVMNDAGLLVQTNDYSACFMDPALGRFTSVDPLAEKYYSVSPYAYCAGNPIRFIDPNGMKFTERAWKEVGRLLDDIGRRVLKNASKIEKMKTKIDAGNLSGRKKRRYQKKMNRLSKENSKLVAATSELVILHFSDQEYDIKISDSVNTDTAERGTSEFNEKTNCFDMVIGSESLNLLSHELKHAYQFETGSFSSGKRKDGAPFYDKHDELEAYQRGVLFGGPHVYSINSLPPLYNQFQDGPLDYKSFNKVILSSPKALQNIANSTQSNFRVNGVTYKYQSQ